MEIARIIEFQTVRQIPKWTFIAVAMIKLYGARVGKLEQECERCRIESRDAVLNSNLPTSPEGRTAQLRCFYPLHMMLDARLHIYIHVSPGHIGARERLSF